MRWLKWFAWLVLVLLLAFGGFVIFTVQRSFPTIDGDLRLSGLDAPVEIVRDAEGVPHIYARSEADLFFAQGYVHAQDRFWQMDFWRHVSAGRLAELFGQSQVETDTFLRSMGWHRLAEAEYETLPHAVRVILDAYTDGVNAYLDDHQGSAISLEYGVLWLTNRTYAPAPWTPADSLAWGKVMAWDLRSNLGDEIDRAAIAAVMGTDAAEELYPAYPDAAPLIAGLPGGVASRATPVSTGAVPLLTGVGKAFDRLGAELGGPVTGIGSNSWVVDGTHTASGKPILANDPHLGIQMPSIWYQVGLHCRPVGAACGFDLAGVSFAGAPGVVIGHNARIAWGFTNEGPDTMDLYVEKVNPANSDQYEVDGDWVDMEVRTETIEVAGGPPVEITVRTTRHGLVVTDLLGLDDVKALGVDAPAGYAVALRWRALEPSTLWQALVGFDRAANWDEFRQAASYFDIAAQNLVYADVDGNIGYQATGQIPIRAQGDGRYPVPGWDSSHEWTGFVPFEQLPRVFNPRSGMIVAANQPVIWPAASPYLGADFDYGFRARRITALLQGGSGFEVDDMTTIQKDTYDYGAEILVPALLELPNDEGSARVRGALASWAAGPGAYLMDKDSAGAAAFAAVWKHLLVDTFDDQLPDDTVMDDGGRGFAVIAQLLDLPTDVWWDDATTAEVEIRDDILARAMRQADTELVERLGKDPAGWKWGSLHTASFRNATFGESGIAPIELLFNRSAGPVSGSTSVVDAVGWSASKGYEVDWLPSMRMVVDLADVSNSTLIHTTGQSGHAFKDEYTSMIQRWLDGRTTVMRWTRDQVDDGARGTLRLAPE